jgi:large subunit ribosomal protein L29
MKIKDLRSMSKEDLNSKLNELRKEMIKHNAQIAIGTAPKSPGQVREIKKTIAKIMTIVGTQKKNESDSAHTQKAEKEKIATKTKQSKSDSSQKSKPSKKEGKEKKSTPKTEVKK